MKIKTLKGHSAVQDTNSTYQAESYLSDDSFKDQMMLDELVKDIEKLDKESHYEIYINIRKYKPDRFFTTQGNQTFFNRDQLSLKELRDLYNIVQLSKQSLERKRVIKQAEQLHYDTMKSSEIDNNDVLVNLTQHDNKFNNPSEEKKLEHLLDLQRKHSCTS